MTTKRLTGFKKAWKALAFVWASVSITLLFWSLFSGSFNPGLSAEIYWLAVSLLTPVTFVAFGWDKLKAKRDSQRIPEKTLYVLALLGGWPGAVVGQSTFRHKTTKARFRVILAGIVLIHVVPITMWVVSRIFSNQ